MNSTSQGKAGKPAKPYLDFPLFPHATRRWAKKIRGKLHYFGPWSDPDGALQRYLDQRDDLHAGRTPRVSGDGLTVVDLANRFLTSKQRDAEAGEISLRTFRDYHPTCARALECFGKRRLVVELTAGDFGALRGVMAKTLGLAARKLEIQKTRAIFNFAYAMDLIDRPVRFGPDFRAPSARVLKKARRQNGAKMFSAEEIRAMLDAASTQMKAMIVLGINAGYGNNDLGSLPFSALDLERGWVEYARPKTGVDRKCHLWSETIDALKVAIASRPTPKDPADVDLVFIKPKGRPWVRLDSDGRWTDDLGPAAIRLLKRLGLYRPGRTFYNLRHVFETIAGGSLDQVAVNAVMGHSDQSMAAVYRERISDDRLRAVANYVRGWLFGSEENE